MTHGIKINDWNHFIKMQPVTRCLIQNIYPLRRPATAITERERLREIIHRRKLLLPLLRTHRACINIRMMRKEQRIHARGARLMVRGRPPACLPFQSTRPMRSATQSRCGYFLFPPFQSTRPVRGATEKVKGGALRGIVSIHAPRVGRDFRDLIQRGLYGVSIHAPRVGRDRQALCGVCLYGVSIHAPRVGRDFRDLIQRGLYGVSIHAPRVGRDDGLPRCSPPSVCFNPRAPCGARLPSTHIRPHFFFVSIHAPRVGRDTLSTAEQGVQMVFQSTRTWRGLVRQACIQKNRL